MKDPRLIQAFASNAFPCNPTPFANGIAEYVRENGTDSIKSDEARAMLWVLMAQSYGQLATIDLCNEWDRLYNAPGLGST